MKVLVFTSLYPNNIFPNHGVFVKERMTHFAKLHGCQVKVVAPVPYFPPFKFNRRWQFSQVVSYEVRDELDVYHPRYYMTPKIGMSLYGIKMFLSVLPAIKRIQKNFDFNLIDAHFVYPDGLAAVLLARYFKKPVVVSARGSDINLYSKFPLIRRLLQYTLTSADKVIAVSHALKEAIATLGIPEEKIFVVPNGVDPQKMRPIPKQEARRTLSLPKDKRILLSVGNLTPNKGFDLVIKALKVLLEECREKNLYLVIVGEGPHRAVLQKLVALMNLQDHVFLAGLKPHNDLYLWYSAADLFCLASAQEGWPNVVLESISCETPVVATPVGGIPEIIRSDKIGLLAHREALKYAETIHVALKKSWRSDDLLKYARMNSWGGAALTVRQIFESILSGSERLLDGQASCGQATLYGAIQKEETLSADSLHGKSLC